MKMCQSHWEELRAAIDIRGLSKFVSQGGKAAGALLADEVQHGRTIGNWDPLMAANFAIFGNAIEIGGLYLMTGDLCPLCERTKHTGKPAAEWIDFAANDQLAYARQNGLVPAA